MRENKQSLLLRSKKGIIHILPLLMLTALILLVGLSIFYKPKENVELDNWTEYQSGVFAVNFKYPADYKIIREHPSVIQLSKDASFISITIMSDSIIEDYDLFIDKIMQANQGKFIETDPAEKIQNQDTLLVRHSGENITIENYFTRYYSGALTVTISYTDSQQREAIIPILSTIQL